MITVNFLKDLYYWCKEDIFVEITEEMLEAMKAADRQESAMNPPITWISFPGSGWKGLWMSLAVRWFLSPMIVTLLIALRPALWN